MSLSRLSICIAALAFNASAAGAGAAPNVAVTRAWSRPVAAGLPTGVAYLTLRNASPRPDRLLGASTPVAARASLHQSMDTNGMMSMTPVSGLDLAPHAAVALAPGGYHLMLEGLKAGLKAGNHYPLTLRFAHAAPETMQVAVRPTPP